MPVPRRTLRDIRTLTGRVDRIANPYMAYMQITCLEMEKARKGRERASALARLGILDARLREIEGEKATLIRALAESGAERHSAPPTASPAGASRLTPPNGPGRVRLRY